VAAKIEEGVFDADLGYAEKFLPEPGKAAFDIVRRFDEIAVELRAVEGLVGGMGGLISAGLRDERVEVE